MKPHRRLYVPHCNPATSSTRASGSEERTRPCRLCLAAGPRDPDATIWLGAFCTTAVSPFPTLVSPFPTLSKFLQSELSPPIPVPGPLRRWNAVETPPLAPPLRIPSWTGKDKLLGSSTPVHTHPPGKTIYQEEPQRQLPWNEPPRAVHSVKACARAARVGVRARAARGMVERAGTPHRSR